jgi:hypothetical protein
MMSLMLRRAVVVVASVLPGLVGCYEYKPLVTAPPPVGEQIALEITDQGRVGLSERFGPGLSEIRGRLVSAQGNEYVLNVSAVAQLAGTSAPWSGETTRIDRAFIGRVKGRRMSPVRTTLLSVVGAAGMYFLVTRGLSGLYTGDRPEETGPTPLSNRLPRFSR